MVRRIWKEKTDGQVRDHEEFGANALINYREDSTSESFLEGMSRIAPPGMKLKRRAARDSRKGPTVRPPPGGTELRCVHVRGLGHRCTGLRDQANGTRRAP